MFKYINTAIIGAMCLLAGACSGDEPMTDTSASGSGAAVTRPVNFSVGLNDFGSSRSSFDEWPDGACVMMYDATTSSVYGFVSYSASSNQWTATFTTAPASGENQPCRLYYVPGWTASDYSTTSTVSTLPTVPNYAATTTYDYVNDELNLFGVLEPLTGRLRLRSETPGTLVWNRGLQDFSRETLSIVSSAATPSESTAMIKDDDGFYYTPYLYIESIPSFRRGNYIYTYTDKSKKLKRAQSVVIEAPDAEETTSTWSSQSASITGYLNQVNVYGSVTGTLISGNYENADGFRLYGSFTWKPYSGSSLSYSNTYPYPFFFNVKDKDGTTTQYYVEPRISSGTYTFEFDISSTSISQIYVESHFDVYVTINSYTLEYK